MVGRLGGNGGVPASSVLLLQEYNSRLLLSSDFFWINSLSSFANSFSKPWWLWFSLDYNFPLSDLVNEELWYESWTGNFCWSFGIEEKHGVGIGVFYNYSILIDSNNIEFDNMVYRFSIYYSI